MEIRIDTRPFRYSDPRKTRRVCLTISVIIVALVVSVAADSVFGIFGHSLKNFILNDLPTKISTTFLDFSKASESWLKEDIDIHDYEIIFNEYRESKECEPLIFTDDLNWIARIRLTEIQKNYSHESEYNKYLGENIVKGVHTNHEAFTSWENSHLHKMNMLDSVKYSGYAIGNGYAVQVFSIYDTVNGIPQLPLGLTFD